jgi:osmotically inducible protein OsmC
MPTRNAGAEWQGDFKRGSGTVAVGSGAFDLPYNFSGRFEDGAGTNPEEILGAAHAACFAMALSVGLTQAGTPPEKLDVSAAVTIDQVEGGFEITKIALTVRGTVPGVDADGFQQAAQGAKENCPLSKALAAVKEITLDAALAD